MSCWRNLEMSGPKRRAPMSYCAEPAGPAGVVDAAVPESIRLPEYRYGFSGVWLSVSPGGQRLAVGAGCVAAAVRVVPVGGLDLAGVGDELRDRAVHVGAVRVRVGDPGGVVLVGHLQPVTVVVVGVRLGLRVGAARLLLLGDQAREALVGEVGGAVLARVGVVLGLLGGAVERVVGVGGHVGARRAAVHSAAGQTVEIVIAVVGDEVRRGTAGAGRAVRAGAGRGGDTVEVAGRLVPVLGRRGADGGVGDLVAGVAAAGGLAVLHLGGHVAGPDGVVAEQLRRLVEGVRVHLPGALLVADEPVPGVVPVLGVARAGRPAGRRRVAVGALQHVAVGGAVAVDVHIAGVEVAHVVRLGDGARAVAGLQVPQLAVVELGPDGGLLLRPGRRVGRAARVGPVGVALLLPAGALPGVDGAGVVLAGGVGAQVKLLGQPVRPVVGQLVAARRLGLGTGVVLLAVLDRKSVV